MTTNLRRGLLTIALVSVAGIGAADAKPLKSGGHKLQAGKASWYGHGSRTANGERFNPGGYTAAHRTLPFGTRVKVVNERTGRSVVVRINDRGPFIGGRIIDLSRGSARALGVSGVASVSLYRI
jgi:rare lipoprotein A